MAESLQVASDEVHSTNCFLCDINIRNDRCLLLFGKREQDEINYPLSVSLSSILGKEVEELTTYSKVMCEACHLLIQEYEIIEQRYLDLKYKIVESYNKTASKHGAETIPFGVENEEFTISLCEPSFVNNHSPNVLTEGEKMQEHVSTELLTILCDSQLDNNFVSERPSSTLATVQFQTKVENEEYFDESTENMVEVMSEDVHYEQIIEHNSQTSCDDSNSTTDPSTSNRNNLQSGAESATSLNSNIALKSEEPLIGKLTLDVSTVGSGSVKRRKKQDNIADNKVVFECKDDKYYCRVCSVSSDEDKNEEVEFDIRSICFHLRSQHNIRTYICDICGEDFRKRIELTEHMDEDHGGTEDGEFPCETCNRVFTNLRLFRIHKRLHYTSSKQFLCVQCNKKYSSKNLLEEHMNMHTGRRPYKCNYCPKDFASKYTLTAHLKIHSDRPRPFACRICPKAFFSAQNLQQHVKTHSGVKEFICEACNKAFGTQHNLEVHKVVHTGYKPFICRTCGKAFARRAEIKDHERTHTGEKPFTCDICNMSFAQRSNLTTHKRATHFNDKRYKCDRCDRSFKRRRLLDYHIRATHTGERPYKCEMCSATFVYPEHYKKHLRIHTGVKPYACEVCGKTFNSRDNRNAHRFIHSDKKPYECLVCGQGFMRKPLLYTHMQQSGHYNDTIVVNQPRVSDSEVTKDTDTNSFVEENIPEDHEMDEEHLIIDGPVQLATTSESQVIDESTVVPNVILSADLSDVMTSEQILVTDEGHFVKNEDGSLQMVQIRTKDENGKERFTWVNLVSEKEG